jgi:hypothetical protein
VRHILTSYKKIARMAGPITLLVRIACRCPDRDCYPLLATLPSRYFEYLKKFAPENNALKHHYEGFTICRRKLRVNPIYHQGYTRGVKSVS